MLDLDLGHGLDLRLGLGHGLSLRLGHWLRSMLFDNNGSLCPNSEGFTRRRAPGRRKGRRCDARDGTRLDRLGFSTYGRAQFLGGGVLGRRRYGLLNIVLGGFLLLARRVGFARLLLAN